MLPPSEWPIIVSGATPLMDQLGEIVDVGGDLIVASRPLAVAVTAQIGGDDMLVVLQAGSDPVPIAAMIASAMQQQQRGRIGISPIDVMQSQTLREINARGRAGAVERHPCVPLFG